jgi:hypothetical protein
MLLQMLFQGARDEEAAGKLSHSRSRSWDARGGFFQQWCCFERVLVQGDQMAKLKVKLKVKLKRKLE